MVVMALLVVSVIDLGDSFYMKLSFYSIQANLSALINGDEVATLFAKNSIVPKTNAAHLLAVPTAEYPLASISRQFSGLMVAA